MIIVWGGYFFAKKNLVTWTAWCSHCRAPRTFEGFDAFEWVHFYGIPLIPVGRKHVTRCVCRRHRVVKLDEWTARVEEVRREARALADDAPPAALLSMLSRLTALDQVDEARSFVRRIERDFTGRGDVLVHLAAWHDAMGENEKAHKLALQAGAATASEVPPVEFDAHRRAVIQKAIERNDHETAMKLTLELEKPEPVPDIGALVRTAEALLKAKRLKDAYALYTRLFAWFPERAAKHLTARTSARRIEKELGIAPSIVPASANSRREAKLAILGGVVVVLGAVIANFVLQQDQTLFVANPSAKRARLAIGTRLLTLEPGGHQRLTIAEGSYPVSVQLEDGYWYKTQIELSNDVEQRFRQTNAFVFNVLGARAFEARDIVYGTASGAPHDPQVFLGHDFIALHDIDYAFTEPPRSISRQGHPFDEITRRVLYVSQQRPLTLLEHARRHTHGIAAADARAYAEGLLRGGDQHLELIQAYRALCQENGWDDEATKLLTALGVDEF